MTTAARRRPFPFGRQPAAWPAPATGRAARRRWSRSRPWSCAWRQPVTVTAGSMTSAIGSSRWPMTVTAGSVATSTGRGLANSSEPTATAPATIRLKVRTAERMLSAMTCSRLTGASRDALKVNVESAASLSQRLATKRRLAATRCAGGRRNCGHRGPPARLRPAGRRSARRTTGGSRRTATA